MIVAAQSINYRNTKAIPLQKKHPRQLFGLIFFIPINFAKQALPIPENKNASLLSWTFIFLRRRRDSNSRYSFPYTHFPGVLLQPLGHVSIEGLQKYKIYLKSRIFIGQIKLIESKIVIRGRSWGF
jgi:hypothetical protein